MSSTFGNVLHLSIFGQSHSPPSLLTRWASRRASLLTRSSCRPSSTVAPPGRDETATKRREADAAHIIAGVVDGHTTGSAHRRDYREHQHALQGLLRAAPQAPSRTCGLPCARKVSQHARCRWWRAFFRPPNGTLMHRRRHCAAGTRGPRYSGDGSRGADRRHLRPADGRYGLSRGRPQGDPYERSAVH